MMFSIQGENNYLWGIVVCLVTFRVWPPPAATQAHQWVLRIKTKVHR